MLDRIGGTARSRVLVCLLTCSAAAAPLVGVHSVRATAVNECTGQFTITIPDSLGVTTLATDTNSWVRTCAFVNTQASPPIWGDVQVVPDVNGNSFSYTGNCVEGTITYTNGGQGVFIAGIVAIVNAGSDAVFIAVVAPNGVPCQGVTNSTRTWSGVSTYAAATP